MEDTTKAMHACGLPSLIVRQHVRITHPEGYGIASSNEACIHVLFEKWGVKKRLRGRQDKGDVPPPTDPKIDC